MGREEGEGDVGAFLGATAGRHRRWPGSDGGGRGSMPAGVVTVEGESPCTESDAGEELE